MLGLLSGGPRGLGTNPGAPAIVEAAITAEDIKPEKTYSRGSGKKQGPAQGRPEAPDQASF